MERSIIGSIRIFDKWAKENAPEQFNTDFMFKEDYLLQKDPNHRPKTPLMRAIEDDFGMTTTMVEFVYPQKTLRSVDSLRKSFSGIPDLKLVYYCIKNRYSMSGRCFRLFLDSREGMYSIYAESNTDGDVEAIYVQVFFSLDDFGGELCSSLYEVLNNDDIKILESSTYEQINDIVCYM